jgi:hypothetical protein
MSISSKRGFDVNQTSAFFYLGGFVPLTETETETEIFVCLQLQLQ